MERIVLLVDGEECTLREFVHANTEEEGQISLNELLDVIVLAPFEEVRAGMVSVKRIK